MEVLEVSKVVKQVRGLVSFGAAKGVVEAFSANFWPNLVSRFDSFSFLC